MKNMLEMMDEMFNEETPTQIHAAPEAAPEAETVQMTLIEEPTPSIPGSKTYFSGGMRHQLVFDGVCIACAHCGFPLTDSESVERGLGPICSKKGYLEEVEPKDDAEAMMALAEYPELVDYLVKKYKPKGNRGLVNGLVRTASLNRRSPVHAACSDAIEALGYTRLASLLRESLSVVDLKEVAEKPDYYGLWIKKSDFSWSFWAGLRNQPGVHMVKVPKKLAMIPKVHRKLLAKLLVEHYEGLYIKTPKGAYKITQEWFGKMGA